MVVVFSAAQRVQVCFFEPFSLQVASVTVSAVDHLWFPDSAFPQMVHVLLCFVLLDFSHCE